MAILELRILPPIAIGRLGSSETPLEAFDLEVPPENPLGYRRIVPQETLVIDAATGAVERCYVPDAITFKDGGRIRPVAPFLEVYARTADDVLEPLTLDLLAEEGLTAADVKWTVAVGNIKIFRRTGDEKDKILARAERISDHEAHPLSGECAHFFPGKTLPLGSVRYIRPTAEFPEIRLRFTPAAGYVYGSSLKRHKQDGKGLEVDPVFARAPERILYNPESGSWRGYSESSGPALTNPAQIYAGYADADGNQVSWGYLDDECDGTVIVELALKDGRKLTASAHISAGPPAFAPDTLPVRTVSDELEQILHGPEVEESDVPIEAAQEIIRRAFETVRLMNTAVMNGNTILGRSNVASTMVRQDTNDYNRRYQPIMAASIVDNLALLALHQRAFVGLSAGAAPWFAAALRRPEEVGDLSDAARRKMPALMRGADGRALVLTRRQIDTVLKAASSAMFRGPGAGGAHE